MLRKLFVASICLAATLSVTGSAYAAPSWLDSSEVLSPITGSTANTAPELAVDGDGNATAVFNFNDSSGSVAKASTKLSGSGEWSTPVTISGDDVNVDEVKVATLANGDTLAVWINDSTESTIEFSTLTAGSTNDWSDPKVITTASTGSSITNFSLAASASGTTFISFDLFDGTSAYSVKVVTGDTAGNWDSPVDLSDTTLVCSSSQVATNDNGDAVVIWRNTTDLVLQTSDMEPGASWSAATDVLTTGTPSTPQITIDQDGNETAIWRNSTSGSNGVKTSTKAIDEPWPAASTVVDLSTPGINITGLKLASGPTGKVIAAWESLPTGASILQTSVKETSGGAWSTADLTGSTSDIRGRDISFGKSGEAVAIWSLDDDGSGDSFVQTSRMEAGSTEWSTSENISNAGLLNSNPRTDVDDDGDAVAVWDSIPSDSSTGNYTESASYDANAPVISTMPSFPADSAKPGSALDFSATVSDFSSLTYSWDFGDGESSTLSNPSHAYATAGDYTVTLSITDEAGNTVTASTLVSVFDAVTTVTNQTTTTTTSPTTTSTTTQPTTTSTTATTVAEAPTATLSGLKISKKKIKRSYLKRQLKRKRSGLKLRFTTDIDTTVTAVFYIKKGKKERRRSSFTKSIKAGKNSISIPAKVAKKLRKRGKYVVKLTPVAGLVPAKTVKANFKVL